MCFFTIHCNPSFAYIALRDLQSSQRNASVQSLLLAGNILYNQYQPSAGEGEVTNFREYLEKITILNVLNEHPVLIQNTYIPIHVLHKYIQTHTYTEKHRLTQNIHCCSIELLYLLFVYFSISFLKICIHHIPFLVLNCEK